MNIDNINLNPTEGDKPGRTYHRALFDGPTNNRVLKEKFTLLDLWDYWIITTCTNPNEGISSASAVCAPRHVREHLKRQLLNSAGPMTPEFRRVTTELVEREGLETVLHAIDILSGRDNRTPSPEDLYYYLHDARCFQSRAKKAGRIR